MNVTCAALTLRVQAVEALLCSRVTQAVQDVLFVSALHLRTAPTWNWIPPAHFVVDDDDDHDDNSDKGPDPKTDPDGQLFHITQSKVDLVQAMLNMQLLPRLRYLVEVSLFGLTSCHHVCQCNACTSPTHVVPLQVANMTEVVSAAMNIVVRCCEHSLQRYML
jgi:hypothetical protein